MEFFYYSVIILIALSVFDLIVGVSNDAVNFLNSSVGSRVAPRHVIMIIASLGILAGVTFSSGMMEVARKGIFHPRFFVMPELITIFLAVMLTDILLLDLFNTFGLPTSTTVSIVFELLGAAVAVSLVKIYSSGEGITHLVDYINTEKAFAIIMGILLSVAVAFLSGIAVQFISRLIFTFDYHSRLKRYGGVWGGISLSVITYIILVKGAKGASFMTPETVTWINKNTWIILCVSLIFFTFVFQLISVLTKINVLKPVVLLGTFALAMAFAANDLVNFIGVPLAGMTAFKIAMTMDDPLHTPMAALQAKIHTDTIPLLIAGLIMVATLWFSRKARTVTKTEISLGRQDEGFERFESSVLSRIIVWMVYTLSGYAVKIIPVSIRRAFDRRFDTGAGTKLAVSGGQPPSFDLLRASVNIITASALVSFATSLQLPLSTTYVTFMVAMGTSLADRAWGRESAVYRVAGVLTVIGGWFFTALSAFSISLVFAFIIYFTGMTGVLGLLFLIVILVVNSYRWHFKKEEETRRIEAFSLKDVTDVKTAVRTSFEQTGMFLQEISDTLGLCLESAISEDRLTLKDIRGKTEKIQKWGTVIVANIFQTLFLLNKQDINRIQTYSHIIRSIQIISESHRDIITRIYEHFANYHSGFNKAQQEELWKIKTHLTRLLWNVSIMLLFRKKVDYDYISNQTNKITCLVDTFDKHQIERIQNAESKTRLSILFYGIMENIVRIAEQTKNLLDIFRVSFQSEPIEKTSA
ncbi:MAG: inorganic phosphate transporter [Deltaproteobacteria bacterium]|nr:MAG: inorganic phosphate transporter [Deltaproteobacteria bacterium]